MTKTIAPILHVGLYLFLIGCSVSYRDKTFNQDVSQIEIKKSTMTAFKMIKTSDNAVLGYLEETENIITSPNSPTGREVRRIFYVYDKDFNKLGFMTEHGTVSLYQYTQEGTVIQISTGAIYTIDAGNRRLLSYNGGIYYEDFEPAPLWRGNK
ncbi:MAG: hypothetical protein AAB038_05265 [Planctomycetota bacterium]